MFLCSYRELKNNMFVCLVMEKPELGESILVSMVFKAIIPIFMHFCLKKNTWGSEKRTLLFLGGGGEAVLQKYTNHIDKCRILLS